MGYLTGSLLDWLRAGEDKPVAKRMNRRSTKLLVVLNGKWRILAKEDGSHSLWVCRKAYDSRQDASAAAYGMIFDANREGWLKLGPSPSKPKMA